MTMTTKNKSTMKVLLMLLMLSISAARVEDLGLPRTNFGVVFRDQGPLQASSHFLHHQIVVKMPKLDDIIPAECTKYIDGRNMNMQLIEEFRKLSSTVWSCLPRLSHPDRRSRTRKHPPRSHELSNSLHSTTKEDDLERVVRKINALIARGQNISETLLSHEKNF